MIFSNAAASPGLFFFYVQLPFFITEKMSVHIQLMVVSIPVCKGNLLIINVKVVIRVNQDVRGLIGSDFTECFVQHLYF